MKATLFLISLLAAMPAAAADAPPLQGPPVPSELGKNTDPSKLGEAGEAFAKGEHEEAIRLAKPRAEAGEPDAIYLMGFASETGKGLPQSRAKAMDYYRQGMAKGHADSIYRLAMNLVSTGQAADAKEAQAILEKQAAKDPEVAGRLLGEFFLRGSFTAKPDPDSAVAWWKKASAAGDVASMNLLAAFHDGRLGFPEKRDPVLALHYYESAAAKGDTGAMVSLGSRLLSGDEKLRDEKQGMKWITKAIAAKDFSGHLALGAYQENIRKDTKAAFVEYGKGAAAGQVDCMIRAAAMHSKGEVTEKSEEKAIGLLEEAAGKGSAQAHLELAAIILKKEKPDFTKGYAHLLTAANGGLPFAQNELGIFYLSGKLGVADLSAAVSWFTRAAKENFAPAQNNLATLYERGAGVPQAFDNALQLYTLAAQQGHASATLGLARLNAAGAGTKQNLELAWALASLAQERGEESAEAFVEEVGKNLTKEQLAGAKKELERLKSGKAAK